MISGVMLAFRARVAVEKQVCACRCQRNTLASGLQRVGVGCKTHSDMLIQVSVHWVA
jgi:hypothetical protein